MRRYFMPEPPNAEYITREHQLPPDVIDTSGQVSQDKSNELARTRPGEPPMAYDVRCIYDSRPPNGYDFNLLASSTEGASGSTVFTFQVPQGYRAVPREWRVNFNVIPVANLNSIQVILQANSADLPNNVALVGAGTTTPVKSFYVVEENALFGCRVVNVGAVTLDVILVQVYGNLIPVTGVALPFEVTNRKL